MENRGRICRLCLEKSDNFESMVENTKDNLEILLLKINLTEIEEPIMCIKCTARLIKCVDFKKKCLDTNNYITPFVINKGTEKLNLIDIYLLRKENVTSLSEDFDICRLCMCQVNSCSALSLEGEKEGVLKKTWLKTCLPELDLSMVNKPVICPPCQGSLVTCFHFVTNCLMVEEKIKKYSDTIGKNDKGQIDLSSVLQYSTMRDIIKNEVYVNTDGINEVAAHIYGDSQNPDAEDKHKNNSLIEEQENTSDSFQQCPSRNLLTTEEIGDTGITIKLEQKSYDNDSNDEDKFKTEQCEGNTIEMVKCEGLFQVENETECKNENFVKMEDQEILPNTETDIKAERDASSYQEGVGSPQVLKPSIKPHIVTNTTTTGFRYKVKLLQCDWCPYQTKWKAYLNRHLIIHKDPSEIPMFSCEFCSYQTRYKTVIQTHMLVHKSPSELQMYQCHSCSYQTKRKSNLKVHQLTHKDSSELIMFKCDSCSFQAKRKEDLKKHQKRLHKDPSQQMMYKCECCLFETKYKDCLKRHTLVHMDPSETTMYQCESCPFQTKHKCYLKTHLLVHKKR